MQRIFRFCMCVGLCVCVCVYRGPGSSQGLPSSSVPGSWRSQCVSVYHVLYTRVCTCGYVCACVFLHDSHGFVETAQNSPAPNSSPHLFFSVLYSVQGCSHTNTHTHTHTSSLHTSVSLFPLTKSWKAAVTCSLVFVFLKSLFTVPSSFYGGEERRGGQNIMLLVHLSKQVKVKVNI